MLICSCFLNGRTIWNHWSVWHKYFITYLSKSESRHAHPVLPADSGLVYTWFRVRLNQIASRQPRHITTCPCIFKVPGWPLVFRFHYCPTCSYCEVSVGDVSGGISIYVTKDAVKCAPDHLSKWFEWTVCLSARLHLHLVHIQSRKMHFIVKCKTGPLSKK